MAVMSTNAVAFLLLNRFRNGVSMDKLVEAMEKLRQDLFYVGRDVGFTGDMVDIINHAVSTHLCSTVISNFHVIMCATPATFTSPHCPILFAILCLSAHAGFGRWAINIVIKFWFGLISRVLFCLDWPMVLFMLGLVM